jgi:hypothetical protein
MLQLKRRGRTRSERKERKERNRRQREESCRAVAAAVPFLPTTTVAEIAMTTLLLLSSPAATHPSSVRTSAASPRRTKSLKPPSPLPAAAKMK